MLFRQHLQEVWIGKIWRALSHPPPHYYFRCLYAFSEGSCHSKRPRGRPTRLLILHLAGWCHVNASRLVYRRLRGHCEACKAFYQRNHFGQLRDSIHRPPLPCAVFVYPLIGLIDTSIWVSDSTFYSIDCSTWLFASDEWISPSKLEGVLKGQLRFKSLRPLAVLHQNHLFSYGVFPKTFACTIPPFSQNLLRITKSFFLFFQFFEICLLDRMRAISKTFQ